MEKKTKLLIGAFGATLVVGIGMGALTQPTPVVAEPLPAVTITPEPVEPVTIEKTPAVCLTALERSEELTQLSAEFADEVGALVRGIGSGGTVSALGAFTTNVNVLTERVNAVDYTSPALACRAKA